MKADVDIPAVTKPTEMINITINHGDRTAMGHIDDGGRGKTVTVDIQQLLDLMTTEQKQTVNTFLHKCATLIWQEVDDTITDDDITDLPDFDSV